MATLRLGVPPPLDIAEKLLESIPTLHGKKCIRMLIDRLANENREEGPQLGGPEMLVESVMEQNECYKFERRGVSPRLGARNPCMR